jgi:ankyrin repeat protein
VRILLKNSADVKKELGASHNKQTPLMIAAALGNLEMVKLLVANGAPVEQRDKLKRTALLHACMNGQTHVAAYFLQLGANPNAADSSGNSCIHYATAYGWYHTVKLLLVGGADPNASNAWKVASSFSFLFL